MASTAQTILNDSRCLMCNLPPGDVWYGILAVANAIANGDTPPVTPQEIITAANCYRCYVPPGGLPYAILKALQDIAA